MAICRPSEIGDRGGAPPSRVTTRTPTSSPRPRVRPRDVASPGNLSTKRRRLPDRDDTASSKSAAWRWVNRSTATGSAGRPRESRQVMPRGAPRSGEPVSGTSGCPSSSRCCWCGTRRPRPTNAFGGRPLGGGRLRLHQADRSAAGAQHRLPPLEGTVARRQRWRDPGGGLAIGQMRLELRLRRKTPGVPKRGTRRLPDQTAEDTGFEPARA